jgi:signal transduction histidine kinase
VTPAGPAAPEAALAGAKIEPILIQALPMSLSGVRVVDHHGIVVASSYGVKGDELTGREEVRRALAGHYTSVLRKRAEVARPGPLSRYSRYRIYVALPIIVGDRVAGAIYIGRTSLTLFRDLWEDRFTVALAVMLLVTLTIGVAIAAFVASPLKKTVRRAQEIAAGGSGGEFKTPGWAPREAFELNDALGAMVDRLEGRARYVEEFTRRVSHELKTPLSGIRGSVELLRDGWREMSDDERERFLAIIQADTSRMERLVHRLLELARIEAAGPGEGSTDLRVVAQGIVEEYRAAGRVVTLETGEAPSVASVQQHLAEALLANLLDNAFVHGRPPVTLSVEAGPKLVVKDCGPGIPAEHVPHVFERFFTTAKDKGGTGLGLAIAKAICDSCRAKISAVSGPAGSTFTVVFRPA